ncbi:hypothetical protein [Bradyrhizobium sp. STM 3557]|uniref:hypothetical protein n=1 Tax=Bradyrhizobium sp. STM 3557 TaxID=578920 RepID=UPI00388EECC1
MLAFRFLLNIAGICLFWWLIFTLAVYDLPFFVAINAGIWHSTVAPVCSPRHLLPSPSAA